MFGKNEIVGRKYFNEKAPADSLLVTSVFHTLQGEGPFAGRPAIFVRLTKCNLACSFCDTFFDKGEWFTVDGLLDLITTRYPKAPLLVITGGEPTLQPNLTGFLRKAVKRFSKVQVESNGIKALEMPSQVHLVISPKCAEKDGKPTHYLKPSTDALECVDTFKFVLSGDPDSPYYTVPDWALKWRDFTGGHVYVSPMTEYLRYPERAYMVQGSLGERNMAEKVSFWQPGLLDLDKMRRNHEHAAAYCIQHGTFLTMQMQLFASIP